MNFSNRVLQHTFRWRSSRPRPCRQRAGRRCVAGAAEAAAAMLGLSTRNIRTQQRHAIAARRKDYAKRDNRQSSCLKSNELKRYWVSCDVLTTLERMPIKILNKPDTMSGRCHRRTRQCLTSSVPAGKFQTGKCPIGWPFGRGWAALCASQPQHSGLLGAHRIDWQSPMRSGRLRGDAMNVSRGTRGAAGLVG